MADGRIAVITDGPLAGRRVRMPGSGPWPLAWCSKPPGGQWEHYKHADCGLYRHAGTCASVGHPSVEMCDYSWHDRGGHRCLTIGEHTSHRCCCGAGVSGGSD